MNTRVQEVGIDSFTIQYSFMANNNVKMKKYLQKVGLGGGGWGHGLHWSGSEYEQVVGSCECSNDVLGSIKFREFLH